MERGDHVRVRRDVILADEFGTLPRGVVLTVHRVQDGAANVDYFDGRRYRGWFDVPLAYLEAV